MGACGSSNTQATPDASSSPCGFEDRYLPLEHGNTWTYEVTDLATGSVETKHQEFELATDPVFGEIIIQTTNKSDERIVSALKREGDVVLRLREEHFDLQEFLFDTVTYDPGKSRIDETPAHLIVGAEWDEVYTMDTLTGGTDIPRTDHWEVLGSDVECGTGFGDLRCLHLKKVRLQGGIRTKEFFFARGVGKVKTVAPNEIEELVSCE